MIMKAVIDRFEENFAVLILEQGDRKLVISRQVLPAGAGEGDWLSIEFRGEPAEKSIVKIELDEDEKQKAQQRIADKLEILRKGSHLKKS
jgi:hypothetical protein